MSTTLTTEALIVLAALKGKLDDPAAGPRYWAISYSTGEVLEYAPGSTQGVVVATDLPSFDVRSIFAEDGGVYDRKGLVAALNAAAQAARAEASA